MRISLVNTHTGKQLFNNLIEAPMDHEAVWLHDSDNGICSLGQAAGYAFIFQNATTCTLAHGSFLCDYKKIAAEVISYFNQNWPNDEPSVFLARSAASYEQSRAEELLFNPQEDDMESATEYFKRMDEQYQQYFMDTFNIAAQVIEMRHHCLVIDKRNTIHLFDTIATDELGVDILDKQIVPTRNNLFQLQLITKMDEESEQGELSAFKQR